MRNRLFCKSLKLSSRNVRQLTIRPKCCGYRRFLSNLDKSKRLRFPSILQNRAMFGKNTKRKSNNYFNTPIWQAQPWYPMLLMMRIADPIRLPSFPQILRSSTGQFHPQGPFIWQLGRYRGTHNYSKFIKSSCRIILQSMETWYQSFLQKRLKTMVYLV